MSTPRERLRRVCIVGGGQLGVLTAVATSVGAALMNPLAMALWATLILLLTLLGMATFMLGLIVVVPWLAHAGLALSIGCDKLQTGQTAQAPPGMPAPRISWSRTKVK